MTLIILGIVAIALLIHNTILQKQNNKLLYTVSVLAGHIFDERGEEYLKKLMK
ncbi:hypothetical protein MTQ89_08295 [Staphylococcus hyicus]|uniref:hypothetical protein n=1 Tax=Staphylococcus hyicus TaxID=1284 RepID=UPI00208F004E|nr:hypothetical protein [Staphylococcus hyicus]MCO4330309.1 hypothetical protein [Staphylococcus hyicus]MCO4336737.1 hypothetical protein [Staphylococcus hyicus]